MIRKVLCLITFVAIGSKAFSQSSDSSMIRKIADEVMRNSSAYENLRFLCKKIGHRLSGSANAEKSVLATAKMLRDAGADTVYLQACMVPHWVRGEKETGYIATTGKERYVLQLTALGNSEGSGPKGVKGEVVEVKSFDELNKLGSAGIKGKIVFFNFRMNPSYIRTFQAYGESGRSRWAGPSEAARYGAIGAMVRSLAINIDDHPHTGSMGYNDSFPKIPAVAISTRNAEWLSARIKSQQLPVTAFFRTNCRMLPEVPSFNVIGEMRGITYPEQIITVGGHLDSWDMGEGAQDDGAGCVQSIEVIRALKAAGIKPKRTIRAVMFMNEENGLAGGKKYAEEAKRKKEKHVFALESDAGGFTPRGFSLEMDAERMEKVFRWRRYFFDYTAAEFHPGGGGADIGPLKELGAALAGLSPDTQRYFDLHHAETDVFESVSKRELDLGAAVMTALVWLVSEYGL